MKTISRNTERITGRGIPVWLSVRYDHTFKNLVGRAYFHPHEFINLIPDCKPEQEPINRMVHAARCWKERHNIV